MQVMMMPVMYVLQIEHVIQMRLMDKCVGGVDNVGETNVGDDDDDDGGGGADGVDVDVNIGKMVQKMVQKMQVT